MSKKLISFFFIALVLVLAAISNPSEEKHQAVLKAKLKKHLNDKMEEESEQGNEIGDLLKGFGKALGGVVIDAAVETKVSSDDYLIFSLTRIDYDGEEHMVGLGLFGQVFITQKLDEALQKGWLEEEE